MAFTPRPAAHGLDGSPAADLGAIRRSDAIIDLLARRRMLRPRGIHDPAIALLSDLAADVDSPPAGVVRSAAQGSPGQAPPPRRQQAPGRPVSTATWVRAAAAIAVAATAAGAATTGVSMTGILVRLARTGGSGHAGRPGRLRGVARKPRPR